MSVKQISVFLENRAGTLESMTAVLGENKIDMRALSLAETKDFGIVRIIVDDVYEATTVLKEAGYVHTLTPVVVIAIPDEPGGLNRILKVFTKAGVNIEYMYAFLGGREKNKACMIFKVNDPKTAEIALGGKGLALLSQEDIMQI